MNTRSELASRFVDVANLPVGEDRLPRASSRRTLLVDKQTG
jgi:hypothetical protein